MNQESPSQELVPLKKRRTRIPDKPNYSLNLWSIMKNCIGKELSKIPMPVSATPNALSTSSELLWGSCPHLFFRAFRLCDDIISKQV